MQNSLAGAVTAVREAGRTQPEPDYVVEGPLDAGTCEACRNAIGKRVLPDNASYYLRKIQRDCECETGCRLSVEHPGEPGVVNARVKKLEEGSEGE